MSQSAARQQRLAVARTFPQAHCPECSADLSVIFNVDRHLERCAKLAAEQRAAAPSTTGTRSQAAGAGAVGEPTPASPRQ